MIIPYLDSNPKLCVQMYSDAQIRSVPLLIVLALTIKDIRHGALVHYSYYANAEKANYDKLLAMLKHACIEYTRRFDMVHEAEKYIKDLVFVSNKRVLARNVPFPIPESLGYCYTDANCRPCGENGMLPIPSPVNTYRRWYLDEIFPKAYFTRHLVDSAPKWIPSTHTFVEGSYNEVQVSNHS